MVQRVESLPYSKLVHELSSLSVNSDQPILSLYLHSHGHDLNHRKQVRVFMEQFRRAPEIMKLVDQESVWKKHLKAIEQSAEEFLNSKEKSLFHGVAFFASETMTDVLSFASEQPLPNDYYLLDIPALGPLMQLGHNGTSVANSVDHEMSSLERIASGHGTTMRTDVYQALNQGQVDTLLLQPDLDEKGVIALSTHTILEQFRQNSPYDGDRVSVAPLREILVYETLRHKGRVQWLQGAMNGSTPQFGILYRGKSRH